MALKRADEIVSKEVVRRPKRLNDSMLQNDMNSSHIDTEFEAEEMPKILTVNELTVSESFFAETINGHKFSDLVCEDFDLMLQNFTVDELVINSMENFEFIEKMRSESDERVKRDTPTDPSASPPLILNDVIVGGMVNGIDFNFLVKNALKTNVDNQRLEAPIGFGRLKAKSIQIDDNIISDVDLSEIAQLNTNETTIISPIRFTQNLEANILYVRQHLNQITVLDDDYKTDALFKRSRQPQMIIGKTFESITLQEPIILQGRINIASSALNQMKPIVTVNEDLEIDDSVLFNGNVTIKNLLSVKNIYGKSLFFNVDQLLDDGLKLDEPVDVPIEFLQPIQVGDVHSSTRINNVLISSLLKRNVTDVQQVIAPKTFTSDLSIEGGNCDANEINGINLQILNNTMVKRSAKNQIVTGTIHFEKINAQK